VKIINVARGGIVDEAALLRALNVSIIMVFIILILQLVLIFG